ncbi:hypothetical protein TDIS_1992 [Thermosulfurimonas dismutans]|uniref:Uncharacterized protein n=1 Tax=Thermosulfurimonas dismutans TaxID=999894 RepID=A0A179D1J5_9BACT|nr:hypothetical protein TDIS_1992 [Thermosulfurimonas dismutans]
MLPPCGGLYGPRRALRGFYPKMTVSKLTDLEKEGLPC